MLIICFFISYSPKGGSRSPLQINSCRLGILTGKPLQVVVELLQVLIDLSDVFAGNPEPNPRRSNPCTNLSNQIRVFLTFEKSRLAGGSEGIPAEDVCCLRWTTDPGFVGPWTDADHHAEGILDPYASTCCE